MKTTVKNAIGSVFLCVFVEYRFKCTCSNDTENNSDNDGDDDGSDDRTATKSDGDGTWSTDHPLLLLVQKEPSSASFIPVAHGGNE